MLKAEIETLKSNFKEARKILESGFGVSKDKADEMYLRNNLARVEGLQGREDNRLQELKAAHELFQKKPTANLTNIIHHNLAMALVKNGEKEKAREVLREAFSVGDNSNLEHVLSVLNNNLHAAREANDQDWVKEIYEEFSRQLQRLPTPTPRQQLALDVSSFRMRRNDQLQRETKEYIGLAEKIISLLEKPSTYIPLHDRIAALVELRGDLKQEIDHHYANRSSLSNNIENLLLRAGKLLVAHENDIETYLRHLSPKLYEPLDAWYSYCVETSKAKMEQIENNPSVFFGLLGRYLSNLNERAELLKQRGRTIEAINLWIIICGDVAAYYQQVPPNEKQYLNLWYNNAVLTALSCVQNELKKLNNYNENLDQLVGVAYYLLFFKKDKTAAAYWMDILDKYSFKLEHYAIWLRDQYWFVCEELGYTKCTSSDLIGQLPVIFGAAVSLDLS